MVEFDEAVIKETTHIEDFSMMRFLAILLLCALTGSSWLTADDWPAFRGPLGNGYAGEGTPPLEWSKEKGIKWKAPLPRPGNSSPIVSNGCVFVTCAEDEKGMKRSIYCFDRRDGRQRWVRTVDYDKAEVTHGTNPYCASTPASDGQRVVVWHGSAGIYCYDFDGKQLWGRKLGEFQHMWGDGTSPVIYRDRVIVHCGPGKRIFVTSLDLGTGETVWSTDEPFEGDGDRRADGEYMGSWSTPLITKIDGKDQAICTMPTRTVGYDLENGKVLWWCNGIRGKKGDLAYSSPVIAGDICVAIGGFGGPGIGFKLGGSGDITESNRLWRKESNPQSIGSGVAVGNYFYRPNAGPGTIECLDVKTGEILWQDRADGGTYWGSIVNAAGRCYVTNQKGSTVVFNPKPEEFEMLAKNDLSEASNATPAISDGEIFLRTNQNVYCISEK